MDSFSSFLFNKVNSYWMYQSASVLLQDCYALDQQNIGFNFSVLEMN